MKIRSGLVSNSSSSSFMCLVKADVFDRKIKTVHPFVQEVVNATITERTTVFDTEVVTLVTWNSPSESSFAAMDINFKHINDEDVPTDKYGDPIEDWEAFDLFLSLLEEGEFFIKEVDI